jgi:hypothetical protein
MNKIQFVIGEKGWIIEAIAKQWMKRLKEVCGEANVCCTYGRPVEGSEIYFHFIYLHALPVAGARNIVYVTHVDYFFKGLVLLKLAKLGVEFVTMSFQTKSLLENFLPGAAVHCISPKSIHFDHESVPEADPLTFGLFFRLYPDKRKKNALVESLISKIKSSPAGVKLIIYGAGFEYYLKDKNTTNIIYDDSSFSSVRYREYLQQCDYVLYFGMDEGAISVLDSACLSVPVLATRQGYHLDIDLPKGSMLFSSGLEVLRAVEFLVDSMRRTKVYHDPAVLLDSMPSIPKYRYVWLLVAFVMPFKANPFRAKDDWLVSPMQLWRGVLRRLISLGNKHSEYASR